MAALRSAALALLTALGATAGAGAQSPSSVDLAALLAEQRPMAGELLLLGLSINGVAQPQTIRAVRVSTPSGLGLAVPRQLWDELHLRLPLQAPRLIDGETHVVLGSDDQWRWRIDEPTQTLLIEAPASAFRGQQMALDAAAARVTLPADWGGFLNYDLQWQRRQARRGATSDSVDGLLEAGLFTPRGPASTTALYRNDGRLVRLDTRFTHDRPERMARLTLGDAVVQPGSWGRALRFGGVQWGTDFTLRPGFLSFPLPSLRGEVALPSTVDILVNNGQRLQGKLQPGPFDISDMPVVTGHGEIRTVVRDLLGREQVMVLPYYVSPTLLKPGLRAFSAELGALREDYGIDSWRYGSALLAMTERRGLSDRLTGELRAELMTRQQTIGAAATRLWPELGTADVAVAVSRARDRGTGWLVQAGVERQSQDWSGSLQLRRASRDFVQAGQSTLAGAPGRLQLSASAGKSWAGHSFGVSHVRQSGPNGTRLWSLNYGRDLGRAGFLGMFALRDGSGATSIALSWSIAIGERSSASVQVNRQRNPGLPESQQLQVQFQRNAPYGEGLGYQLLADRGTGGGSATGRAMGQFQWQNEHVALSGGAARGGGNTDLRASVGGGIAMIGGSVFAHRRVDGGVALVQVADYAGVRVRHDNQLVARTDARGRALLGGLRGYQANRVSVEAADLPFDAELQAIEVTLTPAHRSAARVEFPVRRSVTATFRVVDQRGQALPAGATMRQADQPRGWPVGLEGRAFLAGIVVGRPVEVRWPDGGCEFDLPPLPKFDDDLPDLGIVVCK